MTLSKRGCAFLNHFFQTTGSTPSELLVIITNFATGWLLAVRAQHGITTQELSQRSKLFTMNNRKRKDIISITKGYTRVISNPSSPPSNYHQLIKPESSIAFRWPVFSSYPLISNNTHSFQLSFLFSEIWLCSATIKLCVMHDYLLWNDILICIIGLPTWSNRMKASSTTRMKWKRELLWSSSLT